MTLSHLNLTVRAMGHIVRIILCPCAVKWKLCLQIDHVFTSQNVDKTKHRKPTTVISQNADKPKCQQPKASTDQTETSTKPKRREKKRQTETSTDQNVDKPKRRQTKTSILKICCHSWYVLYIFVPKPYNFESDKRMIFLHRWLDIDIPYSPYETM